MKWYLEALKKYAQFSGRSRRKEYWNFVLFDLLFYIVTIFIDQAMHIEILSVVFSLAMFIPALSVGVRRMHDVNKSGWFIIIPIYSLILCCTEGTEGPNRYGSDPKRPEIGRAHV